MVTMLITAVLIGVKLTAVCLLTPPRASSLWRGSEHPNRRDVRHTVPSVAPYCALHMASCAYQVLDIVNDLDRHEEAKELVFLLTTDAKNDPELQAQVTQVVYVYVATLLPDPTVAANSPKRFFLRLPARVRLALALHLGTSKLRNTLHRF